MRAQATAAAVIVLGGMAACTTLPRPESRLLQQVGAGRMTPAELRVHVRALAPRFSGLIEAQANDIAAQDPGNLRLRQGTTAFKINAIPAMQTALFQPDPVAALIDAWALLEQLHQRVASGPTRLSEEARALADERYSRMEAEIEALWRSLQPRTPLEVTREQIRRWAADHPITENVGTRESTAPLFANLTTNEDRDVFAAAAQLVETTSDLTARIDLMSAFMPKQARWQAEFFALETLNSPQGSAAQARANELTASLQAMGTSVGRMPSVIAQETAGAFDRLHDERLGAQVFVDTERELLTRDLRAERGELASAITHERTAFVADTDQMVGRWIDHGFDRATGLVDRVFRWGILLVGVLVLGGLGALYLHRTLPPRSTPGARRLVERRT